MKQRGFVQTSKAIFILKLKVLSTFGQRFCGQSLMSFGQMKPVFLDSLVLIPFYFVKLKPDGKCFFLSREHAETFSEVENLLNHCLVGKIV